MNDPATMFLMPALPMSVNSDGSYVLTRKFIDGATQMAERWPGPVIALIEADACKDFNLDEIAVHPSELAFGIEPLPVSDRDLIGRIRGGAVALVSIVDKHVRMGRICRAAQLPLVVYTEYTLRTRLQVARVTAANPLIRWRRQLWERQLQRQIEPVIRMADGLQCNGTPTYEAYRDLNSNRLLYFDTRVREEMIVEPEVLQHRAVELRAGGPLRLAFSGRLARMKGADHLPAVARELKRLGVAFVMHICGGGEVVAAIEKQIRKWNLQQQVFMRGVLDFQTELVPFIARNIDLFVCCHRQGDPSCTYLETMSCGVPIAGYDNEALNGLVRTSKVGWLTPMDQPKELAARIAELDQDRAALGHAAAAARDFAAQHTFERTIAARIEHMIGCSALREAEAQVK